MKKAISTKSKRTREDLINFDPLLDDIDSDIVETSALDGTSGDNFGQDEQSDDSDSPIVEHYSDDARVGVAEGPNGEANPAIGSPTGGTCGSNNNNHRIRYKRSPASKYEPSQSSNNTNSRQSGQKLISRRRRSHRRRRNTNDFGDYDHDGDIDRSDDEADNEVNDDSGDDSITSQEDGLIAYSSNNCAIISDSSRWRQDKKHFLRPRLTHKSRQSDLQQQPEMRDFHVLNVDKKAAELSTLDRLDRGEKLFDCNNNSQSQPNLQTASSQGSSRNHVPPTYKLGALFNRTTSFLKDLFFEPTKQGQVSLNDLKNLSPNRYKKSFNIQSLNDRQSSELHQAGAMPVASGQRYQTVHGFDEYRQPRRLSSKNKLRESHRLIDQEGYSKLSHHHYQAKTTRQSILQEIKRIILLLVIVSVSCFVLWQLYAVLVEDFNYLGTAKTASILGQYEHYAVSTDAKPCAKVGKALLAKGGSAVDAAIGTLICMGVVIPNSLGLGGGCLMTIYDRKSKKATIIDGRETAPDYAHEHMFADALQSSRGPLSVGVPGELSAYWKAHQLFGKLKWSELFDDSISMADNGYPVVEHLAYAFKAKAHSRFLSPTMAAMYINPKTGKFLQEDELLVQKALANTLRRIRDNGVAEFYGGETGRMFIEDLQRQGGKLTLENLSKYRALVKDPLKVEIDKDLTLFTQPLPGSGIVLSIILRVMKQLGYYKNLKPQSDFDSASLYYHRLVEAFKFAYGQRAGLEDSPDDPARLELLLDKLKSDNYIQEIASKIGSGTHSSSYYGALEYFASDHGTAHVSVLDSEGNAAAFTSSVNLYFGSGLISPSTGIVYNDVMDDFVSPNITNNFKLAPSKYNRIRPGRKPLSSMAPSIFTDADGNAKLIIGASGGSMITTAVAGVSLRSCFLGDDIKTAIDGPRIHHQFLPDRIYYEPNFSTDLLRSLESRLHALKPIEGRSSVVMAVTSEQENGTRRIRANSDYRKGGSVDGF